MAMLTRRDLLVLACALPVRSQTRTDTEPLELRAGPLSLVFEPETAMVRYVRFGDREVLRDVDRLQDRLAHAGTSSS